MVWDDDEVGEIEEKIEKKEEKTNWLEDYQETILAYGLPKHGKTFAYCSIIEYFLKKGGKAYIISTDSGFARTAKTYFKEKIKDIYNRIDLEMVYDINSILKYYNSIKNKLNKDDILIFDLVSDIWEWAQNAFVEELSHGDVQSFIARAMKDIKSFGTLDSNKWNYVKALHKFVEDIITRKPCNFVGVCTEKNTEVEVIKGKSSAKQQLSDLGFDDLTTRPGGHKLLPYKFETIIRIGQKDGKYFMQVVGDRGYGMDLKNIYYGTNMYESLLEWRKKQK